MNLSIKLELHQRMYGSYIGVKLCEDAESGENVISSDTLDLNELRDELERTK